LKAQTPAEEEVELAEVFVAQAPQTPDTLPATAGSVPLVGLAGLLLLAMSLALRLSTAKAK
jgi:hypothetical protein